ncbi:MAG TPA: hypothetical protein VJZ25_00345, partial [Gemmatimonadaceae bacterium]|nr:hypothetical protein [Gemmatimonadaceae bacterium]
YIPHIARRYRLNLSADVSRTWAIGAEYVGNGFILPAGKDTVNLAAVRDGALDDAGLFRRDGAVDESPVLPASPVVIRAVPGV